jgi:hypothetical protein
MAEGQNVYFSPMNRKMILVVPLVMGTLCECLIWSWSQGEAESWREGVRLAARYSGRLSFLVFLGGAALHARLIKSSDLDKQIWLAASAMFAWVHAIHLGFLALNISQNEVELVPVKLIGGALAYGMILLHPLLIVRISPSAVYHRVHYGYAGFVMGVTFLARINGDFEGAEPSWFHSAGIGVLALLLIRWLWRWWFRFQKA